MKNAKTTRYNRQLIALTLCAAMSPSLVQAEEEKSSLREFLSDPQRVGSLTGTIIGGALTAHPAGAAAGTILGFFVGKQSMFETAEQKEIKQSRYAAASIIPISEASTEQQTLTFNEEDQSGLTTLASEEASDQMMLGAYIEQAPADQQMPNNTDFALGATALSIYDADTPLDDNEEFFAPEEPAQPEQLAAHCYSGQRTNISPREQAMCYYYSG